MLVPHISCSVVVDQISRCTLQFKLSKAQQVDALGQSSGCDGEGRVHSVRGRGPLRQVHADAAARAAALAHPHGGRVHQIPGSVG